MGALKNANKRRAKRAAADELRLASEMHRARLSRHQTAQVANMRRPGGYYGTPFPDDVEKDQAAYVDGKGQRAVITPENVGEVSRFPAGRPRREHSRMIPADSSPTVIATAPTGEESRRLRDLRAKDVARRNAMTPPRLVVATRGPKVREWGIGA